MPIGICLGPLRLRSFGCSLAPGVCDRGVGGLVADPEIDVCGVGEHVDGVEWVLVFVGAVGLCGPQEIRQRVVGAILYRGILDGL